MKPVKRFTGILLPLLLLLNSCVSTASFDQYAYAQTTAAKVEAIDLMSNATQNVSGFTDQIRDVDLQLRDHVADDAAGLLHGRNGREAVAEGVFRPAEKLFRGALFKSFVQRRQSRLGEPGHGVA